MIKPIRSEIKRLFWHYAPWFLEVYPFTESLRAIKNDGVLSVNYHTTLPQDAVAFERQIRWLSENYYCCSEDELAGLPTRPRETDRPLAIVTFDDGYRCNYEVARPILKKYSVPAIFFLIADTYTQDDSRHPWSKPIKKKHLLERSQVQQLVRDGHSIGSHTKSHANLGKVSPEFAIPEIVHSKQILSKIFDVDIRSFALPFGTSQSFRADTLGLISSNYDFFFHSYPGNCRTYDPSSIGRYCLDPRFDVREFALRFSVIYTTRYFFMRRRLDRLQSKHLSINDKQIVLASKSFRAK